MIAISSFFLPWNRGAAATARLTAPSVASSSHRAVASQRPLLPRADDDSARARRGEFGETDFHEGTPAQVFGLEAR